MLSRTIYDDGKHLSTNDLEDSQSSLILENLMEREKLSIKEKKLDSENIENVSKFLSIQQRRLDKFDFQKLSAEDGGRKSLEDEKILELLNSYSNNYANSNGLEIKIKSSDKKGSKQIKTKICSNIEKESNSQPTTKVVGKKSVDLPSLEGLWDLESDRKVHESLDTFIRQTMGREAYMSFTSRPGEKPLQKIIEHQQAMNKCIKSLKVDIDICDGLEDNTNLEPHQIDLERDPSGIKGGDRLGRGLQAVRSLQTIKSSIPQVVATYATTKNPGKQNPSMDHLTDLPGWPLLSPLKVQLQKCEKCSREFFSSFNHQRHTRTHRRISHVDKEDLLLKRKNVAAFWDKLNQDEAQQIFASSRKYDLEDLSGEVVVNHLLALRKENNLMNLPPAYIKAGQDLLDMVDNKQIEFPLFSEQIFSILDEANEKTFLCSQGDVSKIGLEEKNLVASLGFIVEQTLVKAWMAEKDAEALRNQQELVKEEEAEQMKREKNVAKKKKKKEKSRQKGLKERKSGTTQLAVNEDNESIDGENPSFEIVEEDNSPTASSASMNSSGLENPLLEHLEMEVDSQIQNADERIQNVDGDIRHSKTSKNVALEFADEELAQQYECDINFDEEDKKRYSNFPPSHQVKIEDLGGYGHALEQDQNVESHDCTQLWRYREPIKADNQDSYQRRGWVLDSRFQEGTHQNSHRASQQPSIGLPYTSSTELTTNFVTGFYCRKSASLKRTTPFPTTQQWTKKAQTPIATDHVNKNGYEGESSHKYDTDTNKNDVRDLDQEHIILACEMDTNAIRNKSRAEKEEFRTSEKKELFGPSSTAIPSVPKMVAGTGGLSNKPTISFNLNINSEDWPPLSNSHAAYYSKNAKMYSLTPYQCAINSRSPKKLNFDRGCGHQVGLEYKVGGSIVTTTPPLRGSIDETTTGSIITCLQKGIMIGSVSVPLSDYIRPSRPGLESVGRKISPPLLAHQSYTTVLAAPSVQYTRNPMANTIRRQKVHDEINHLEFEDSSNMQLKDSYRDPVHYRTSSTRSTACMNFNERNMKGPTYPLGDRGEQGIFSKQPSWLGGLVRNFPQKVWRPVRSISENADSNSGGAINIESDSINTIEKVSIDPSCREERIDVAPFQLVEGMQLQNIDNSRVDECSIFATNSRAQDVEDESCIIDVNNKKENVPKDVTNYEESSINTDGENLPNYQKTIQVASMAKVDSNNACQLLKNNAVEQHSNYSFHDKKDNTEKMDDMAHLKTTSSHSAWIAEAIEFHLSRWHLGLKDPETIIGSCKEEHLELQTSKWMDFMNNLPSITTRLSCYGR